MNRIALLLRRWAAHQFEVSEEELFGPLPRPELVVTHDLDAIRKTRAIRFKQTAFQCFKTLRALARGRPRQALDNTRAALRFACQSPDYWHFEKIIDLEQSLGLRSHFNVYAGPLQHRSFRERLIDPSYDPGDERLRRQLRQLARQGWTIGLHQGVNCWQDPETMLRERTRLEQALDVPIVTCRQHWLRFSWSRTWQAQEFAGFQLDTTLGF
ncbi:MAG: hypothetical protein AB7K24_15405, partial [Gemmataceae bacterium]